jgi:hypothetical protein
LTSLDEVAWIATIIYFTHFFIVHDVTQIRASFAISLLVCGYLLLRERRYRLAVVVLFVSPLSHVSALIYIPVICYAALVRNPKSALKLTFIALLGMLLFKLLGYVAFDPTSWVLDTYLAENTRLLGHLLDTELPDVKGLGHEMFFYLKLLALGVVAFNKQAPQFQDKLDTNSDWHIRAGLIVTFACMLYVSFYDIYVIGARLSDLAAPFECAVLASFIFQITNRFKLILGAETVVLARIALTVAIVIQLFGPQLALIN